MANLDVALRLRLINGLKAPAGEAKRDLDALRGAAQRLNGVRAGGLATDLGRIATAGSRADDALRRAAGHRTGLAATGTAAARLGNDLGTVAGRAGQADAAMKRLGAERSGLVAVGAASARLGTDLSGLAAGAGRTDAALRRLGTERAGLVATGSASARLGADLSRLTATAGRTDAALRRIGAERTGLAAGSAAISRLGNDLHALERAAGRADGALDRVGAARSGLTAAGSATARLSGELSGAARNAGRLADNLTRATTVVPRIRAPRVEEPAPGPWGARPSGPASAHPRPARPATRPHAPLAPEDEQRARAAAGAESGTILALGNKAIAAAGGLYVARGALRATVGEAISFEKAWAEVVKKVNDAPNPEAMQQLQRTVAKTAIELGLPRNGLAEMTAEAGAAGIKFQDLERYVRLAAAASVGWDMAPREAAQNLAEIKSAGQLTIAEMDVLADKINALGDNSAAKERDIVEMFQRAAEGARLAGSDMDTTLAALTALKSGGMQADVASRFYGAFTGKLRTAGGEGKGAEKVNDALKEIGLTGKKVAEGMARDANATITDILERIGKHADPVKVAQGLMGQEWWDELAKFTGGSLAEFRKQLEFLRDPKNFKGSLTRNLDTQLSTTANHLERLKALTGDVGDRMGRWALPGINQAIQGAIRQMDELERRQALQKAEGEGVDWIGALKKRTPLSLLDPNTGQTGADGMIFRGADWLYRKGLDALVAPLPTQDPSRALVERRAKEADDEGKIADKNRAEAKKLEERAAGTKDKTARATLLEQARREREAASRREARAAEGMRGVGPAGARDMTDVEFGEAAARASIETKRRIALLERGLGAGNQPNVRIPDTGVVMGRQAAEAELLALRKRFEALGGPPAEPQAPAPAPARPVMTVPLPPARPGAPAPATPLPPARPASLTPPAAPVQPEPTAQPDATVQPAPTIQPQPTIQPAPVAPQSVPVARAGGEAPAVQPSVSPAPAPAARGEASGTAAALQQRIGLLERALAAGSRANVRIPDTGIVTSRRGVEAEIAELRRRVESQRPAPAGPAPERPATAASAPPAPVQPVVQPVAAPPRAPAPAPAVVPVQARPATAAAPAGGGEAPGVVAALQQRIGLLERALAGGSQANVRIPDTGIVTSRRGVEAEIAELRRRVESQRPAPAVPASAPRTGAGLGGPTASPGSIAPKVDPQPALDGMRAVEEGAKRLQTTMGQDLSAPARESMQSYTAALKAGTAEAVAAVTAAVAQMKAALSFTASPTITPRLVAPTGAGAAPAGGAPAAKAATPARATPAGPPSSAPRAQSASLRRGGGGGGGVTITGPIHVHGVKDVAGMHRQISRMADRRARDARDGALHDTGVESA